MVRLSPAVLAELTDYQAWSRSGPDGEPVSLFDYVGMVATPDLMFGFAELFMPDLVVHEGLHFLASGFSAEGFEQWRRAGHGLRETQRVMNHVHVSTLLQQRLVSDELALTAARAVAAIWRRTLTPEGLIVEVVGADFWDAAVTFFDGATADAVPG